MSSLSLPERDATHHLPFRLARAMGWGVLALGVVDLGCGSTTIAAAAQRIGLCAPQEWGNREFRAPVRVTARLVEGAILVVCGIVTIRSPRLLFRVCFLATAVAVLRSVLQHGEIFGHLVNKRTELRIAWVFEDFLGPIIALPVIISLYRIRHALGSEPDPPLCRMCGYDLRGVEKLTCPECGRHYAPNEFYRLNFRRSVLLMRTFAASVVACGVARVGARLDMFNDGAEYLGSLFLDGPTQFDILAAGPYDVVPFIQQSLAQIGDGTLMLVCGIVTLRSPRLLIRTWSIAMAMAIVLSAIEYNGTFGDIGPIPDTQVLWMRVYCFSDAFRAPIVGLFVLTALYPVRRTLGLLQSQSPVCQSCALDLRENEDLCCPKCGRLYTPYEFYRLRDSAGTVGGLRPDPGP